MIDRACQLPNIIINKVAVSEKFNRGKEIAVSMMPLLPTKIRSIAKSTFGLMKLQNYVGRIRKSGSVWLMVCFLIAILLLTFFLIGGTLASISGSHFNT